MRYRIEKGFAGLERLPVGGDRALSVVRVEDPDEELRVAHALERRVADEVLDLRAHVDAGARLVEAGDVHDERELLDEAPVVALGLADADLRLVALGERLGQRRRVVLQPLVAVVERPRHLPEDREERGVQEQDSARPSAMPIGVTVSWISAATGA